MKTFAKRLLFVGLGLVLLLVIAVGVFLVVGIDSAAVGRRVLDRAGARLGLELDAEAFRFHLLRGLEIEGLTARGRLDAGDVEARLEALVLRHELWPLFSGRVVIRELRLERPEIELTATPESGTSTASSSSPAAAPETAAADSAEGVDSAEGTDTRAEAGTEDEAGLDLEIQRARLRDGRLVLRSADPEGEAPTEVHGLDLRLDQVSLRPDAPAGLVGVQARGELSVTEVIAGELRATEGRGKVALEDGHLRLADGRLRLDAGEVRTLELDLDLSREPFAYELTLGAEPLRTGALLAVPDSAAGDLGPSRFELTARGRGSDFAAMDGQGRLAISEGTLPESPLLTAIDALVEGVALVGADYEPMDVGFQVRGGRVEIQPLQLTAGEATLDLEGWAVPAGPLELRLSLGMPREGVDVKEIPEELLDALTDADGRLHLPLLASATMEGETLARVRVVPDTDALEEAGRQKVEERVQEKIEEELGEALRKLFGDG